MASFISKGKICECETCELLFKTVQTSLAVCTEHVQYMLISMYIMYNIYLVISEEIPSKN